MPPSSPPRRSSVLSGYGSGSAGIPNLRSTQSTNYDLSLEWYFDRDSAIYTTLFRREVDGLVVPITSLVRVPGTGLNTDSFLVTRPQNASKGVLKGIELRSEENKSELQSLMRISYAVFCLEKKTT